MSIFKKRVTQLLSASLSMFLMISSATIAFAANPSVDEILLSRGYPAVLLSELCEEVKVKMSESEGIFEEAKKDSYDENLNLISTSFFDNETSITPYGQIQTNHLSLTWVISRNSDNSKNVTLNYNWTTLPLNRWQDMIALSWDLNCFYPRTGSFYKADKYTYTIGNSGPTYTGTASSQGAYANGGESGCAWYADLKGHSPSQPVWSLFGYATIVLVPITGSGSSRVYAYYAHKKVAGSLSIAIPNFGNFALGGSSLTDELGTQTDIAW